MRYLDRHPGDPEWGHAYGPGADGVRLHYVRRGHGEPVVLLHGWPGFWYDWRHVIVPLAEEADVMALDFRGFGDSDKPEGDPKDLYTQDHPASQREAWYGHFHALPWAHELVGYNRDTVELYLRHFYDCWVGNKESVRP